MKGEAQMEQLTVNDFFCGCGGMGIGFKNAGYEIVGAWDFDKFAVESYKANVGDHVQQADIKDMTWKEVPEASVWTFGFPCQDLSVAGKQAGMVLECIKCGHQWKIEPDANDSDNCPNCGGNKYKSASRSGLFFEIMRLLDETDENSPEQMPKVLIAENVKGLKPFIGMLEAEFKKRGYTAHIELYNSKYWGVPQNRERYYIVGIRDGEETPFNMPTEDKDPNKIPKLSTALEQKVDEKYYISDDKAKTIIGQALKRLQELGKVHATLTPDRVEKRQNGRRAKTDEEEMFTLTAQDLHGVIIDDTFGYENEPRVYDETSPTLRGSRQGIKTIESDKGEVVIQIPRGKNKGGVHEIAPTLTANSYEQNNFLCEKNGEIIKVADISKDVLNDNERQRRVYSPEGISPTLLGRSDGPKILVDGSQQSTEEIEEKICKESGLLNPNGIGKTLRVGGHGSISKKHNYQHILVKEESEEEAKLKLVGMLDMKGNESIRRVYDPEWISPTLTASQRGHRQPKIIEPIFAVPEATKKGYAVAEVGDSINISHINSKTRRGRIGKEVAQTLLTGCEQVTLCPTTYRVRKLTPTEYGRLQAFPMDEWEQVVSDTQAYKQFGNAVTTTVATAIAEAIKTILLSRELEEKNREFDPVERLKNILFDKNIDSTEEDRADIIALEMAIELMTTARNISEKTAATMERIGG